VRVTAEEALMLGMWYRVGNADLPELVKGLDKSTVEATRWWDIGAQLGSHSAICNLALCCAKGWGVDKDRRRAKMLYHKVLQNADIDDSQGAFDTASNALRMLVEKPESSKKGPREYINADGESMLEFDCDSSDDHDGFI
jgi:hypothetical protein